MSKVKSVKLDGVDFAIIKKYVEQELVVQIKKSITKTKSIKNLVVIPDSVEFINSFKVKAGPKGVTITSDWPTANAFTNPNNDEKPFPMTWLKPNKTKYARIELGNGIELVRATPTGTDFWIHPGFKKYDFLQTSIQKGMRKALNEIVPRHLKKLSKTHNFFK